MREAETEPSASFEDRVLALLGDMRTELTAVKASVNEGLEILRSEQRAGLRVKANALTNIDLSIEQLRESATRDAEGVRGDVRRIDEHVKGIDARVRHIEETCFPPPPAQAAE